MLRLLPSGIFRSSLAAATALAVFTVAGCKPAREATAPTADKAVAASASRAIVYPATDYYEQSKGVSGGILKVSVALDTGSLDLHAISHTNAQWLGRMIYDNLVYLDEKGAISPWLAKSWAISPDGKTYTFHLRDDVTFSDGAKFNAEAVRLNLEHMRAPATKSPLAAAYIQPYVDGKVIDEFTFQANLREPYTPFLEVLAQSWLAMVSPKQIVENPKRIADAPVGSGPFVVESYARQQGIKFVRRADYHWAPPVLRHVGPAYLERIELEFVPEALVRYTSLASGQYDFTTDAPAQNAASIRADPSLVLVSRVRKGIPNRGVTFNVTKEPFTDVKVRKAFALAVDREGIAQITGFGEYKDKLKTDYLASTTRYYDPAFQDVLKYNVPEANRLLDEAGWTGRDGDGYRTKDGRRLSAEILVTETATPSAVTVAIQSDVKKIGFELKIVQLPAAQLTERRNNNTYQAMAGGVWHTNTPDALYILHHSKAITTPKLIGQNTARLQDAQLDDLLTRARQSTDPVVLQELYSKAQRRLTELVPAVPLYENVPIIAYRNYVKGVVFDTSHNTPVFTCVWLDKEAR